MSSSQGRNSRKRVALVQTAALLAVLAQPVAAATAAQPAAPVQILTQYKIVRGDEKGDLKLGSKITRAEMATILVRAKGLEAQVASSMDLGLFPDTVGHWSRGYVNVARLNGLILGYEDGSFRPDAEVTYAEALTMVLRVADRNPSATNWPLSVLLMAQEENILPPGVANFQSLSQPAIRLDVFTSLGQALTEIKTPDGKTYLQKYVDNEPPTLSVNAGESTTESATETISGTVRDAVSVTINGVAATLTGTSWSGQVALDYGENSFLVEARDAAGNVATKTVKLVRNSPVARLDVTAPAKVGLGAQATITIKAFDKNNREVALTGLTASVEGSIGTFDVATRTFTAANKAGKGKLNLTIGNVTKSVDIEIQGQAATASQLYIRPVQDVSSTKEMAVEVEVRDAGGNRVEDFGRTVTLSATGQSGIVVTPTSATTVNGVATFKVKGSTPGVVSLIASSNGLSMGSTTATFTTPIRVVLVADNPNLVVGGNPSGSRIRAELRDENGNLVPNNSGSDIFVTLTSTGQGFLTDSTLTIRRGYSNSVDSGDSGLLEGSGVGGSAVVSGMITTGQSYSISSASVNFQLPVLDGGSKLQVLGPISSLNAGTTGTFVIRVTDARGNLIPTGSYAFQLKIDTSNNDKKVNGVPEGVTVWLGDTALNPVDDGIVEGAVGDTSDIIARTVGGQATIKVKYTKGGSVTITPVLVNASVTGYADNGAPGTALPSGFLQVAPLTTTFIKPATNLSVTVDSDMGADQPSGALPNNPSRYFTVRVRAVDADGNFAPAASIPVTIAPANPLIATVAPSPSLITTVNGVAEFKVFASTNFGEDTYKLTSSMLPGVTQNVTLRVNAGPVTVAPTVLATRGVENGIPHTNNRVAVSDTHLEIDLARETAIGNVSVKVFQSGTNTLIYQSPVVDMGATTPQIRIPKEKLVAGNAQYVLAFNNGSGDGTRSAATPVITNARELSHVQIAYARYNAAGTPASPGVQAVAPGTLSIYTSGGLSTVGATIQTDRLTIVNGGSRLHLIGATAQIINSGRVDVVLTGTQKSNFEANVLFSGTTVNLEALAGWYMADNGDAATADLTGNAVGPAAVLTNVVYDKLNRQLVLDGFGFDTGNVNVGKLSIYDPSTDQTFLFNSTNIGTFPILKSANRMVFALSNGTGVGANLLDDTNKFTANNALIAQDGWLFLDGASTTKGQTLPLFTQVRIDSVSYAGGVVTIYGAGFSGQIASSLDLSKLKIVNAGFPANPVQFDGTDTAVIVSDGVITITLSDDHKTDLADTSTFNGANTYLTGDAGWLTVNGRNATPIPTNQRVGGL